MRYKLTGTRVRLQYGYTVALFSRSITTSGDHRILKSEVHDISVIHTGSIFRVFVQSDP